MKIRPKKQYFILKILHTLGSSDKNEFIMTKKKEKKR
jgi:hypothetical protein